MLTPRLTNCTECANIQDLINEIDCKLAQMAGLMYNNVTLLLHQRLSPEIMSDLLHYKRILQYKYVNSLYASNYTVNMIASRVKLLKFRK